MNPFDDTKFKIRNYSNYIRFLCLLYLAYVCNGYFESIKGVFHFLRGEKEFWTFLCVLIRGAKNYAIYLPKE